jgi:hypothetical protein
MLLAHNPIVEAVPEHVCFDGDVVRARNRLAWYVLREMPDATHVLWWDSDIVPLERTGPLVAALLGSGEDVIGVSYVKKSRPMWTHMALNVPTDTDVARGRQHVLAVGFGFTLTSTRALREVAASVPRYTDMGSDQKEVPGTPDMFDLVRAPHPTRPDVVWKLSEDFSFCHRWRELGGNVALYLGDDAALAHVGPHAYVPPMR